MSKTIQIASPAQFSDLLKSSKIVVTDYWCGPCKQIAPIYEALSSKLSRPNLITFAKVNTDSQKEIASNYAISVLPTFMIFRQGAEVEKIKGSDVRKLQDVVRQLAAEAEGGGSSSAAAAAATSASAGAVGNGWRKTGLPNGYGDITDQLEIKGLDMLNMDDAFGTARTLFDAKMPSALDAKGKSSAGGGDAHKDWVESDTDEQLMLFMPFMATLKVHTLQVTSLPSSSSSGDDDDDEAPMRPKTINIYSNRPHILGFEEAEDIPPTQTVTLSAADWDESGTANLALRYVKFQNVTSLVLFVVNGDGGGEKVRLDRLKIIGETGEKRELGKLEKIGDEAGE